VLFFKCRILAMRECVGGNELELDTSKKKMGCSDKCGLRAVFISLLGHSHIPLSSALIILSQILTAFR